MSSVNPYRLIWRADPVRMPLPPGGEQDLAALRAALPNSGWLNSIREGFRGRVDGNCVVLQYYRPFRRSDLNPVLDARLTTDENGPCLVGVYRMSQYGRVFMSIWFTGLFALLPFFLIAGVAALWSGGEPARIGLLVVPLVMVVAGFLFLKLGQQQWDDDKRLIEQFIRSHLQKQSMEGPLTTDEAGGSGSVTV
jgi:hypothetical protein